MNEIKDQLNFTLDKINLDGYGDCYKGKVRDNYSGVFVTAWPNQN